MIKEVKPIFILKAHRGPVHSLVVSSDNKLLLSSCSQFVDYYQRIVFSDNNICLWNLKNGKLIKRFEAHNFEYYETGKISIDFLNNNYAISASNDYMIKIWDLKTFKEKIIYRTGDHKIDSMKVLISKFLLVTGGNLNDKTVRIWNLKNGECIRVLIGHKWAVDSVDLYEDGNKAISSSSLYDEKPVIVWDVNHSKKIKSFGNMNMRITGVKFLTGKYAVTTGNDKVIRIWNISTGKINRAFIGHIGYPTCLKEFSDNKYFATGNSSILKEQENHVYIWDIVKGELKVKFLSHTSGINALDISPNNKKIITGCNNGCIYVWKKPFI